MTITIPWGTKPLYQIHKSTNSLMLKGLVIFTIVLSIGAIAFVYSKDAVVAYGDSESHLNIAKRVVDSITPGASQLGGIWLPIPHVMMLPFIWSDTLWRTGLAGSIVSAICYVISTAFLYHTIHHITQRKTASIIGALTFALNPNVLYMQATPMSELPLIMFFVLSTYYFLRYIQNDSDHFALSAAGLFSFLATLSRYDGWFLVGIQGLIIIAKYIRSRQAWGKMIGKGLYFGSIALLGVVIWIGWCWLILGDPLYFTNSEFSAKSQQEEWNRKGQLPSYRNLGSAVSYYTTTAASNAGFLLFLVACIGIAMLVRDKSINNRFAILALLLTPYLFYILTLFIGQSIIFVPHITPSSFEWRLFNVRYGLMMVPCVAILIGYMWSRIKLIHKQIILSLALIQALLFLVGYSPVLTYADGAVGLSKAKRPDAERWIKENYDGGLVLMDDYARSISIVRSGIPMEQIIYIGNKPYWEESFDQPERHARWIVTQKDDAVWRNIISIPEKEARLYTFFQKVYTSPDTIIFRRQENRVAQGIGSENFTDTFWRYQCIDTMKVSRDAAQDLLTDPDAQAVIDTQVSIVADMGANCVAVGTPYDDAFLPVLRMWVSSARAQGLHVWFRGNWSAWEGWFGAKKGMTTQQHLQETRAFISANADLFLDGDIFTGAPEAENGGPFTGRSTLEFPEYRAFLISQEQMKKEAFRAIGVDVVTNWYSQNGWIAQNMYDEPTLEAVDRLVTVDHYTPTVESMDEYLTELKNQKKVRIALGEFGNPIPDLNGDQSPKEQAQYLQNLMTVFYKHRGDIEGLSYWTLKYGSTAIITDADEPKPASDVIRNWFKPGIVKIELKNQFGSPLDAKEIRNPYDDSVVRTDYNGIVYMRLPSGETSLKLQVPRYESETVVIAVKPGEIVNYKFTLKSSELSRWERFRLWIRTLVSGP